MNIAFYKGLQNQMRIAQLSYGNSTNDYLKQIFILLAYYYYTISVPCSCDHMHIVQ